MKKKINVLFIILIIFLSKSNVYNNKIKRKLKNLLESDNSLKEEEEQNNVNPPIFSHQSGFYPDEFELILSSKDDKTTLIYYTIDSTDPKVSNTSQIYKSPILIQDRTSFPNVYGKINYTEDSPVSVSRSKFAGPVYNLDKGMVIRAVTKNSKGIFSEIISNIYFVTNEDLAQYQDLTIISMITSPENLFDPEYGIYVTGNQYIKWKNSDEYDKSIGPYNTKNKCNFFMKGKEWEREADIKIFNKGEIIINQNMGIRIKGASTRNNPCKSFNLYARKKYGKGKVEGKILDDNYDVNGNLITNYKSFGIRCVYEQNRLKEMFGRNLLYSRKDLTMYDMKEAILFLNGEYWGLYLIMEKLDNYFIESNYLIPNENVTMIKGGKISEGPEEELENLKNFCKNILKQDLSDNKVYEEINNYIDVDSMIELYGTGIYIGTGDWPYSNEGIWKNSGPKKEGNKYSDGKWRFITYDLDYTMGAIFNGVGSVESNHFEYVKNKNLGAPTNLFLALLKNSKKFQIKFINVYCDYANYVFNPIKINKLIDEYRNNFTEIVSYSQLRWWGYSSKLQGYAHYKDTYLKALEDRKKYFEERADYTIQHMKDYINLKEKLVELTVKIEGKGKIKINTIIPELIEGKWSGNYFTNIPITLIAIPDEGFTFKGWEGGFKLDEESIEITLSEAITIIANFA